MHSKVYGEALNNDEITFFKPSDNSLDIPTYKGMCVIVDDNLTTATAGVYVTILFGPGAVGYAVAPPRTGYGTELWRIPSAGNGGGVTELHSRFDVAFHPLGFAFTGSSVAGVSPTQAELGLAANWTRAYSQRKAIPLAFLISLAVWILVCVLTRYVSLASICGALSLPIAARLVKYPVHLVAITALMSALAIYKHKANIVRLMNGTENKVGRKQGPPSTGVTS